MSSHVMFDGEQFKFKHKSSSLECEMTFSVYLPSQANSQDVPIIYWLSGLTCTDDNFVQKSGAQKYAAENGVALVCPDTSPRGDSVPNDLEDSYDLGLGAGFFFGGCLGFWAGFCFLVIWAFLGQVLFLGLFGFVGRVLFLG